MSSWAQFGDSEYVPLGEPPSNRSSIPFSSVLENEWSEGHFGSFRNERYGGGRTLLVSVLQAVRTVVRGRFGGTCLLPLLQMRESRMGAATGQRQAPGGVPGGVSMSVVAEGMK